VPTHAGHAPPGLLVAIEGIDGAGTTTQARRLVEWLNARGRPAHATREPSTGPIGALLRAILRGEHAPADGAAIALLFAADRLDHLAREVEPELERGRVVVSDRYVLSSLAYQSVALDRAWVEALNARARPADLTLLVEVPVEIAAERRRARGGADELFDALDVQRRVALAYRREAERLAAAGARVAIVDGRPDPDRVFAALSDEVAKTCLAPSATPS
jgi:dTMP kinase